MDVTIWCTSRSTIVRELLGFFFSSRRRHTRCGRDWSSDVCSSDLALAPGRTAGGSACPVRAAGTAPAAGHALPPAVLPGASAVVRLGASAYHRELRRLAVGGPAGGDGVHDAAGAHPRPRAGLPAVRHVAAPAGADRAARRPGPLARLDLRRAARRVDRLGGAVSGGGRRRLARTGWRRRGRGGEHRRPAHVRLARLRPPYLRPQGRRADGTHRQDPAPPPPYVLP